MNQSVINQSAVNQSVINQSAVNWLCVGGNYLNVEMLRADKVAALVTASARDVTNALAVMGAAGKEIPYLDTAYTINGFSRTGVAEIITTSMVMQSAEYIDNTIQYLAALMWAYQSVPFAAVGLEDGTM